MNKLVKSIKYISGLIWNFHSTDFGKAASISMLILYFALDFSTDFYCAYYLLTFLFFTMKDQNEKLEERKRIEMEKQQRPEFYLYDFVDRGFYNEINDFLQDSSKSIDEQIETLELLISDKSKVEPDTLFTIENIIKDLKRWKFEKELDFILERGETIVVLNN